MGRTIFQFLDDSNCYIQKERSYRGVFLKPVVLAIIFIHEKNTFFSRCSKVRYWEICDALVIRYNQIYESLLEKSLLSNNE